MTAGKRKTFYWWYKTTKKNGWMVWKKGVEKYIYAKWKEKNILLRQQKKNQLAACVCLLTHSVDFNCHIVWNFLFCFTGLQAFNCAKKQKQNCYGCWCLTCQQVKNTFPKVLSPIKFAGNQAQSTKHFMRCCWYTFPFFSSLVQRDVDCGMEYMCV